jgi:hypothetical protein
VKNKVVLKFLMSSIYLGLVFNSLQNSGVSAQTSTCSTATCQTLAPTDKPGWRQGQEVMVYIDPAIQGDTRSGIVDAFTNWQNNNGSGGNRSFVTYTFVSSPPAATDYSFRIFSQAPTDNPGARAETEPFPDSNGYTQRAETFLDPRVTNRAAVTETMAHEIGHPAGFGDCKECAKCDSVMGPFRSRQDIDYYNVVTGRPTAPTSCDNQKLQSVNYGTFCNSADQAACQINGGLWDSIACFCDTHNHGEQIDTRSYCSAQYLVTDFYIVHPDGTRNYWYSTWDYIGISCSAL